MNRRHRPDHRLRGSDLAESVHESEGFSVYEALVDRIDWTHSSPWTSLLHAPNESQRALVAVAQFHEHAQVNGLQEALEFHGPAVTETAAEGAERVGQPRMAALLRLALASDTSWDALEARWHEEAEFQLEPFIERNPQDFFIDETPPT